ncbi:uncharacterized protein RCC_09141 [Ramularia collo-cygni]|uniref:BTB domain-containing protein n=1 Tax=Ramularia collo-cygni TaxID=112498 RepID=A0A2D3UZE7_9PEZI|nr:uncharacterized protein RCC_09141 [Ramularia collo-cygni]CZT23427.1 uncharacterized protein RCC_09141 [Ramularia collo-cygni]
MEDGREHNSHGRVDLTLLSKGGTEHYVHQVVVCPQSPVLFDTCAALRKADWEPTTLVAKIINAITFWNNKAQHHSITIEGEDVAVAAMVHFFYHGNYYPDKYGKDAAVTMKFDKDLEFHTSVLKVAEAYKVKVLVDLAQKSMKKAGGGEEPHQGEHADSQGPAEGAQDRVDKARGIRVI